MPWWIMLLISWLSTGAVYKRHAQPRAYSTPEGRALYDTIEKGRRRRLPWESYEPIITRMRQQLVSMGNQYAQTVDKISTALALYEQMGKPPPPDLLVALQQSSDRLDDIATRLQLFDETVTELRYIETGRVQGCAYA